jgi:hypothetical protein
MSGDFGYGQVGPNELSHDLNGIYYICRSLVDRLDTMKLVQVVAVHIGSGSPPSAGTVDVLPLVSQIDGNGYPVKHGTVYGLPYYRMQGGPWAVICDPAANDIGYVICADRDSSLVVKNGGQQNPGSRRRYNIADGVYVGGVLNAVPKATVWLKPDGTFNITDQNNNSVVSTSSGLNLGVGGTIVVAITSSGVVVTGTLSASGDITSSGGNVIAGSIDLQTHTHSGVTTGGGETGPPVG